MSTSRWIVLAIVVVVVAVAAILIGRRVAYTRGLKKRGWAFDSSPVLAAVLDHHAPPFGLGFGREPDELVSGATQGGMPFRVFEYKYTDAGPDVKRRLASIQLPYALPDLFVAAGPPRVGVVSPAWDITPGLTVSADDEAYARTALGGGTVGAIQALVPVQEGERVDLAVDGNHLVAVGAPKNADELAPYLEALAAVAGAVTAGTSAYATGARPPAYDFYRRPDWVYVGQDDGLIGTWGLTTAGHGHRTENVVRAPNDGLPFDAFMHRWETTRTETSTDSEGRTTTRTVTEHHQEVVLGFWLPDAWPLLTVGRGFGWGSGDKVGTESAAFDEAYPVRTASPRFASDVIHPRQMEYLMAVRPPSFQILDQRMRFSVGVHDTLEIGRCADIAHGFMGRVPGFVWKNLGSEPPTFRV